MTLEYIRKTYQVPAYRGTRVKCRTWDGWCDGTITSGTNYVIVRPDKWKNARLKYHPDDFDNIRYEFNNHEKEQEQESK